MTADTHRATQDEARGPTDVPRRARPWRFFLKGGALALMLGVGWIAGAKMHELADLARSHPPLGPMLFKLAPLLRLPWRTWRAGQRRGIGVPTPPSKALRPQVQ